MMTFIEDNIDTIILGDCLEVMKQMPDKCVDLVLTDPPYYRIVTSNWDRQWKSIGNYQAWTEIVGLEIKRILKDNGSFYWFGDDKNIAYCQIALDRHFNLLNSIVWEKMPPMAKGIMQLNSFCPATERILFYEKGSGFTGLEKIHSTPGCFKSLKEYMRGEKTKLKQQHGFETEKQFNDFVNALTGTLSVVSKHYFADSQWCFPTKELYAKLQTTGFFLREYEDLRREYEDLRRTWVADSGAFDVLKFNIHNNPLTRTHETQKPIGLISYLVERSSRQDDLIFDPFSGSGTTAVACHKLNRRFICVEKDPDYWQASVQRLENEQKQLMLGF